MMKKGSAEYTTDNLTMIVEELYTEGPALKDILKEYLRHRVMTQFSAAGFQD